MISKWCDKFTWNATWNILRCCKTCTFLLFIGGKIELWRGHTCKTNDDQRKPAAGHGNERRGKNNVILKIWELIPTKQNYLHSSYTFLEFDLWCLFLTMLDFKTENISETVIPKKKSSYSTCAMFENSGKRLTPRCYVIGSAKICFLEPFWWTMQF